MFITPLQDCSASFPALRTFLTHYRLALHPTFSFTDQWLINEHDRSFKAGWEESVRWYLLRWLVAECTLRVGSAGRTLPGRGTVQPAQRAHPRFVAVCGFSTVVSRCLLPRPVGSRGWTKDRISGVVPGTLIRHYFLVNVWACIWVILTW